jgi:hypothetical protein
MPNYEHIRKDLRRRVEYAVPVRPGRTGPELLAELEHVLAQRLSRLRSHVLTDTDIIAGPCGPDQGATVILLCAFDVRAHEQCIGRAIGRPRKLASPRQRCSSARSCSSYPA